MIRVALMSDLHLETGGYDPGPIDADLIVLAGDIGPSTAGIAWAASTLAGRPVCYVAGNREHWHHQGPPLESLSTAAAATANVAFLADRAVGFVFAGRTLTVIGCTLWTDFARDGKARTDAVMGEAGRTLPDYRNGHAADGSRLTPAQVLAWHRASRSWLETTLTQPRSGPVIVVSHHAPDSRSLPRPRPGHVGQITSVSSLAPLIERAGPDVWAHGHTHSDSDYVIGRTRVVSRQRGSAANGAFAPLLIEV